MYRIALLVCLLGCQYETNYYYGDVDAGSNGDDMSAGLKHNWEGNFGSMVQLPCFPALSVIDRDTSGLGSILLEARSRTKEPEPISVVLQAPSQFDPVTPNAELVAVVEWGAAGVPAWAIIDWKHGQTLSFVAENVRVRGIQQMIPGHAVPVPSNSPRVGAYALPALPTPGPTPQRTISSDAPFPKLAVDGIPIPRFARGMRLSLSPAGAAVNVTMINGGTTIVDYPVAASPSAEIPIPPDLAWNAANAFPLFTITNTGAVAIVAWRATFDLSL